MGLNALRILLLLAPGGALFGGQAPELRAGVARADITDYRAGPVNDPSYVKALVLESGGTVVALVTVDAVAIGELGRIGNGFLPALRARLEQDPGIPAAHVLVTASHCHSTVRTDSLDLAVAAVRQAWRHLVPVHAGAGRGREDRIMENRRLKMKDGSETDVRRAYSMPPDEEVAAAGPVDPDIGVVRLDRKDGSPLAVLYNFAAHPIMGVPGGGNTADFPGFASRMIEENLNGAMAFFVQGCAGDINPAKYKDLRQPLDAEPLGNRLGLSVLGAWRGVRPSGGAPLRVINRVVPLPRADHAPRIAALRREQAGLVESLRGTSLSLDSFVPLYVQYKLSGGFPAYYSHRYLHEKAAGREELAKLDAANRADLERYIRNVRTMERLTRLGTNLQLLEKHQARNSAAGGKQLEVEVAGLRVGDFFLVAFPGELSVEIGLGIKKRSPAPLTFVAGYTNGYIYYTPTDRQLANTGYAQEDCDTLVAPGWQELFEGSVAGVLRELAAP